MQYKSLYNMILALLAVSGSFTEEMYVESKHDTKILNNLTAQLQYFHARSDTLYLF